MQFSIDVDAGTFISGWVVLENPGETPSIVIEVEDLPSIELVANVNRPDLVDVGLHATGLAGFRIDGSIVPNIEGCGSLCIREKNSSLEIYRRFDIERNISEKVFIFSFYNIPQRQIARELSGRFGSIFMHIERHPYETIDATLNSPATRSLACLGRPSFLRLANAFGAQGFFVSAILGDPFEELAERLLLLRLVGSTQNQSLVEQQLSGFLQLRPFVERLDFSDDRALRQAFRGLSQEQRAAISNPVTRALACEVNEPAERRHVGLALDNLARMNLVGTVGHYDAYRAMFNDLIGETVLKSPLKRNVAPIMDLAQRLATMNTVIQLIEHDLALYSFAEEAVMEGIKVWDGHFSDARQDEMHDP